MKVLKVIKEILSIIAIIGTITVSYSFWPFYLCKHNETSKYFMCDIIVID
jgi:hypothetical protein